MPAGLALEEDARPTATLLLRAGVAAHLVQRILRRRDLRTTLGTYAHLDVDDMRGVLTNLPVVDPPDNAKPAREAHAGAETGMSPSRHRSRIGPMRGAAAAMAISATLASTALSLLAALCCASAPFHSCCAKGGTERKTWLERASCCTMTVAMHDAARDQVTPHPSTRAAIGIPACAQVLSNLVTPFVDADAPTCMQCPASPPLGPPLRLRI
jgi:hypothetical protein